MTNKRILIVEDDVDVRLGYHVMLKANGYDTFFAVDGLTAMSEARLHRPDLVLLDLGISAGDGFVVLERFRASVTLALIPVIVVSARDIVANKDRALKAGAKAFVQKPWNDDELLGLIKQQLAKPTTPLAKEVDSLIRNLSSR